MPVKLAVVGGGSRYTPELVDGLLRSGARIAVGEIALLDSDQARLDVVGGMARRMLRRSGWEGRLVSTARPDEAIDGADFVLLQLRVGGQRARLGDETLPLRFGRIGQETTGAGGFAKALRTVPVVLGIAEIVARRAAPSAWIVDFTNPVGIVTQALLDGGHRAIGLCNVAIGFQRRIAAALGVDPNRVVVDQIGLNHLTWIRRVLVDGEDRLTGILDRLGETLAGEIGLPVATLRALGAIPSYYLKYYYREPQLVAQAGGEPPRAQTVLEIEQRLLEMYADPAIDTKPALLDQRGGAYYSEAAIDLIASLHDGRGDLQVVDVHNGATLPALAPDDVIEATSIIDRAGAQPIPQPPLDNATAELVRRVKAYERLAVEAARTGSRDAALEALITNPLVADPEVAVPMLDELLEANRQWLPQFAGPA
jgi:6-phospho-beta-glucosidase